MKKKKPDFFEAFNELPIAHKAAVVVGLRMYARVIKSNFGSITFAQKDVEQLVIFDESPLLDPAKARDFATALERLV